MHRQEVVPVNTQGRQAITQAPRCKGRVLASCNPLEG
jgi:hypothetical protein